MPYGTLNRDFPAWQSALISSGFSDKISLQYQRNGELNMEKNLIAPCGMNCGLCSGYLALINNVKSQGIPIPYCAGCRPRNKQCAFLKKRCQFLLEGTIQYCFECSGYPCDNLTHLDKRYRSLFHMSMIENLNLIKEEGIEAFLNREEKKWLCPNCGGLICCHNGLCFKCGIELLKNKKQKYRWG
jgi:hypothetical protein